MSGSNSSSVRTSLWGAAVGLAVGVAVYLVANPWFEGAGGTLEEFQGLLWNVVPLGLVLGAVTGWAWSRRG